MAASSLASCASVQRFLDAYLDGEFGDRERGEIEAHLDACDACRALVREQGAFRQAVRAAAPREKAPAALRGRIERAVAQEESRRAVARLARRVMPMAAAAGIVAALVASRVRFGPVAADVVAKHQRNLPLEVQGGLADVARWYTGKVDFPVRPLALPAAALRGGRLANVGDRQAAYLVYEVKGGSRVSVFIFDPSGVELEAQRKAVVGNREIYLDEARGFNVALFRDRGMGYAVASDLDRGELVRLVSAAVTGTE